MGNCLRSGGKPPSPPATRESGGGGGREEESLASYRGWPSAGSGGRVLDAPRLRVFTLAELRAVTRGFKPEMVLGEGGFGRVYKGWVDDRTLHPAKSSAGVVVAVKRLNAESVQGLQEWQSEVNFLGRLQHPNLVRLLGYCGDGEDRDLLLVYEFMPKGSLENHLFRSTQSTPPCMHPSPFIDPSTRCTLLFADLSSTHAWRRGRLVRAAVVGDEAEDRRGRGAGAGVPALAGDADHLPGLQGVQHPPRPRLRPQAVRLRAGQERAGGGAVARHHAGHGQLRLRGARVRRHGPPLRQERRLRLRRGAAGAAHGAPRARPQPAHPPGQPRRVGAPLHRRRQEAHRAHGSEACRPVPAQGGAPGRQARAPLPLRRPQGPALHGRRRRQARGDRRQREPRTRSRRGRGPSRRQHKGRRTAVPPTPSRPDDELIIPSVNERSFISF
ncbi:hypothetical protein CFC21_063245 [Triticum aestivum]|uniref:non-specific serine/threonine protein kinase n=3 Tax=Triticinae TaxID=1648030 RepID=A0A9R1GY41_WHEAT|nr:hypothetical protein CFC21_063245 [Triticum aestivum]